jgi:phage gp29-like protein
MPTLYDADGNPIDKTRLVEEVAAPTVTGVRQILSGHPAQNLSPRRLAALLLAAEQGDAVAYLELAEEMEEKDLHYRSVLSTRKLQVSGLPVTVEAASDAAEDVKAADLVRDFLSTGVLANAMQDILDAVGKGFSACEILWDTEGKAWYPSSILWRDPRWFEFDRLDGVTLRLKGENGLPEPLVPAKFITHVHKSKSGLPIRGGLARPVAWYYLFKNFGIKSWVQFAQVFGFPLRLGRYDAHATPDEKEKLLRAVRNIAQDAAAIIPANMQIEFQSTDVRGNVTVFEGMASYFDKQISKVVLGQTGTTDVGQHVGTANAHEKVREDIEASDAAQLSATLNRDLVRPLVDLNLGPRKRYPALKVAREEKEDVSALVDNIVKLAAVAPNLVEVSVIRDRLGVPEPAKGAEVIGMKPSLPSSPELPEGMPPVPPAPYKAAQAVQPPQPAPALDPISLAVQEELDGWEPLVSPLVNPILALAGRCSSYEDFLAGLPGVLKEQDAAPLARSLSFAMFEQRVKGGGNGRA